MSFTGLWSYEKQGCVFHGDAVASPAELRDVLGFLWCSKPTFKFHIIRTTNVLFYVS